MPWDASAPQWSEPIFYSLQALRSQQPAFSPFHTSVAAALEPSLPAWAEALAREDGQQRVLMREWEDESWRTARGWKGSDLIHGRNSAVRLLAYFWHPQSSTLRGVVRFGPVSAATLKVVFRLLSKSQRIGCTGLGVPPRAVPRRSDDLRPRRHPW